MKKKKKRFVSPITDQIIIILTQKQNFNILRNLDIFNKIILTHTAAETKMINVVEFLSNQNTCDLLWIIKFVLYQK